METQQVAIRIIAVHGRRVRLAMQLLPLGGVLLTGSVFLMTAMLNLP